MSNFHPGLSSRIHALLCSLALLVCALIAWPFAEVGIDDDWAYIRSAMHLAQTGHIAYFGWGAPIVGWQLYLGALFIKLFGSSFTAPRLSILLVAAVTVFLVHRILVLCGISDRNATTGTLAFALSPIFLPLSVSFMTDVPGLFSVVLCLYLCLRALHAPTRDSAFEWLLLALLSNVVSGTVRQTSWLGAIVLVPCAFWLQRDKPLPWIKAILTWLLSLACIVACIAWFQHQPFIERETPIKFILHRNPVRYILRSVVFFVLFIAMILFPILAGFFTHSWVKTRKSVWTLSITLAALTLGIIALALFLHSRGHSIVEWLAPWDASTVTQRGVFDFPDIGTRPIVLSNPACALLSIAVLAAIAFFTACIISTHPSPKGENSAGARFVPTNRQLWVLLGPFSVVYFAALLPRAAIDLIFQRYALPLIVVALIVAIKVYQERIDASGLPLVCFLCIFAFAFFSVAATHDLFAAERARVQAIDELLLGGVPQTAFYGGFDYDSWTQTSISGYVTTPATNLPSGTSFKPVERPSDATCAAWYLDQTRSIQAKFFVSYDDSTCGSASHFAAVKYRTWLPPFSSFVYIRGIRSAEPVASRTNNSFSGDGLRSTESR